VNPRVAIEGGDSLSIATLYRHPYRHPGNACFIGFKGQGGDRSDSFPYLTTPGNRRGLRKECLRSKPPIISHPLLVGDFIATIATLLEKPYKTSVFGVAMGWR
jgi:hypothetical protein